MNARPVDAARLALGAVALLRPQALVRATGSADGRWPRRVARLLGARYVVQSVGGLVVHERWVPELDAAVDLAHALSTLGLAAAFPRHRRLALTSGALAVGFAAADLSDRSR